MVIVFLFFFGDFVMFFEFFFILGECFVYGNSFFFGICVKLDVEFKDVNEVV